MGMNNDDKPNVGGYDVLVSAEVAEAAQTLKMNKGHRCCGGCCDMRRAVIIMNLVELAICLFYVMYFAFLVVLLEDSSSDIDAIDKEETEKLFKRVEYLFEIAMAI